MSDPFEIHIRPIASKFREMNLEERAVKGCKKTLENYLIDDQEVGEDPLGGYMPTEFVLKCDRQALVFHHRYFNTYLFETTVGIYLPDDEGVFFEGLEKVGSYRDFTELDGSDFDDVLELDYERIKNR